LHPRPLQFDRVSKVLGVSNLIMEVKDVDKLIPAQVLPGVQPGAYLRQVIAASFFHADEPIVPSIISGTVESCDERLE
jgi:hypothetical protein